MTGVEWFKNAVIYHVLIDRFAGLSSLAYCEKPVFLGGTIKGITEKIPYLKKLGVNTLWVSPFYKTSAYHGYHITDFFEVDPHFGSTADLQKLIKEVHKHEMYIIADFVPNHCSKLHPFFKDAQQQKNSIYREWFYFRQWPDEYLCFLSFPELPKLNLDFPAAKEHIFDAAVYWLNMELDGFRLDHVIGPSNRFWNDFSHEIKRMFPDAVLIGEAWMQGIRFHELKTLRVRGKRWKWLFNDSSDHLLKSYAGILDGVLDFRGQQIIKNHICSDKEKTDPLKVYEALNHHYKKYPKDYFLPLFLDNHDMNRFLFEVGNNKELLKKAATIQFSVDQPVIIYYGTEIGMTQKKSVWTGKAHADVHARQPMQWDTIDKELFLFYQDLIKERNRK